MKVKGASAGAAYPWPAHDWQAESHEVAAERSVARTGCPPRRSLRSSFDKHNPRHLLILFALASACSIVAIVLLAGYGVHRLYEDERIRDAERDAVAVGAAVFMRERELLSTTDASGRTTVAVAGERFAEIDRRMRNYLSAFEMYKIKVYARDRRIVYSTDHSIIGQVDEANAVLDRVLELGEVSSKLRTKDRVADLAGEMRFDVDVVETYLPIRAGDAIIGSFEIYRDVTATRDRAAAVLASSGFVLLGTLSLVFAVLFLLMHRAAAWLVHAQDELRALAAVDPLTGVFNRRQLMSRTEEEYCRMAGDPGEAAGVDVLAFVLVDIDRFKAVNDTHGHLAGDEILRQVSRRLRSVLRTSDVIWRYGGEEFLAELPHTTLDHATAIAERMRRAVRDRPFEVDGVTVDVTVSIGVACTEGGEKGVLAAIRRADEQLYRAKRSGRDRVCSNGRRREAAIAGQRFTRRGRRRPSPLWPTWPFRS